MPDKTAKRLQALKRRYPSWGALRQAIQEHHPGTVHGPELLRWAAVGQHADRAPLRATTLAILGPILDVLEEGGSPPLPRPTNQAKVLRRARALRRQGRTWPEVAATLNTEGLLPLRATEWTADSVGNFARTEWQGQ